MLLGTVFTPLNVNGQELCVCVCVYSCRSVQDKTKHHFLSLITHSQLGEVRGHLCLPGLPGDEEEAVVRSVNPVGASLADHHSTASVCAAAAAPVVLRRGQKVS